LTGAEHKLWIEISAGSPEGAFNIDVEVLIANGGQRKGSLGPFETRDAVESALVELAGRNNIINAAVRNAQ
jgi:hypothetical protein